MKKHRSTYILVVIFVLAVLVMAFLEYQPQMSNVDEETDPALIDQQIQAMTLEEKIGQLFIVGFWGATPTEEILDIVKNGRVGGVILFDFNIQSAEQLSSLIIQLQESSQIPLFISIDQEGGLVTRLRFEGIEELTAQKEISTFQEAYEVAKKRGEELRNLGINVNIAPVVDVSNNPYSFIYPRTFKGDSKDVTAYAIATVKGYNDSGILSVLKHFPGHNDQRSDPHRILPVNNSDRAALADQIGQFSQTIKESRPDLIMVGHELYPNIDTTYPSSLSKVIVQDILKGDLSFDGLVVTDDLQMGAITSIYSAEEAAQAAIQAGNDLLLYSTSQLLEQATQGILAGIENGLLSEEGINNSVQKILETKSKL